MFPPTVFIPETRLRKLLQISFNWWNMKTSLKPSAKSKQKPGKPSLFTEMNTCLSFCNELNMSSRC